MNMKVLFVGGTGLISTVVSEHMKVKDCEIITVLSFYNKQMG